MSPLYGNLVGAFTVLLLVGFLAIWAWLWLPRHRASFNRLARLPLEDRQTGGKAPAAHKEGGR